MDADERDLLARALDRIDTHPGIRLWIGAGNWRRPETVATADRAHPPRAIDRRAPDSIDAAVKRNSELPELSDEVAAGFAPCAGPDVEDPVQ